MVGTPRKPISFVFFVSFECSLIVSLLLARLLEFNYYCYHSTGGIVVDTTNLKWLPIYTLAHSLLAIFGIFSWQLFICVNLLSFSHSQTGC